MEAIGYHGTTKSAAADLLKHGIILKKSKKPLWLADGLYFFQDAPLRAAKWALLKSRKSAENAFVMKALIKTDDAIDFLDIGEWTSFRELILKWEKAPVVQGAPDLLFKARSEHENVIIFKHYEDHYYVDLLIAYYAREKSKHVAALRSAFMQGDQIHPNSWLLDESHVQICVRSSTAIVKMEWYSIAHDGSYTRLSDEEIEQLANS